jgi:hypothetical protein
MFLSWLALMLVVFSLAGALDSLTQAIYHTFIQ